ncbi:MAG: UDP-N-acetylglucosamine 1-carboxyvinyltransferase [Clostridiales bacterium]|nr:UDP-N-acetylglucosamine 1-carboxyvinyltransferase [Clostridiales bacterium]
MNERLIIRGGRRLNGSVAVSAAKNSVLPILACCIMSAKEITLENCPRIADVFSMVEILRSIGAQAELKEHTLTVNCAAADPKLVSAELTGKIRSSVFILGPILARFRRANISYPGGCEIGLRPIDLHIYGLKCLGVKISEEGGIIGCDGSEMSGGVVNLDFPSVGATENIMMAGVLADGKTVIRNAAREPEIVDLQNFINFIGGRVYGAGSDVITVEGVKALHGGTYTPVGDRIAAATFLGAAAITGGEVCVTGVQPSALHVVIEKMRRTGCTVRELSSGIVLQAPRVLKPVHKIETQPFPGFPTDMQPQMTAVLCRADGSSCVVENMFENRFKYTVQLGKMGAKILVKDRVAVIKGTERLTAASVVAEDLRGGAALVTAALCAEGTTHISGVRHIDRGYENIEDSLRSLGADIERVR